jgi:hypothetical protein
MSLEEIALFMMLMISPKPTIDINWEFNYNLLRCKKEKREPSSIKFLLLMAMELLKILWEACLVYNLNLLKKI